jgi:eukaryotic-like serine/threonine-protein kinase
MLKMSALAPKQCAFASVEQEQRTRREELHQSAAELFAPIGNELLEAIRDNAPSVEFVTGSAAQGKLLLAQLRGAQLGLDKPQPSPLTSGPPNPTQPGPSTSTVPFTVISESVITVTLPRTVRGWRGRSHSLWFCDAHDEGRFAWYELAFMEFAGGAYRPQIEPYPLSAAVAGNAFNSVIGMIQLGWPVEEIDRSDLTEFLSRWLGWFADAARGQLWCPHALPEKPTQGSWRVGAHRPR